MRKDILKILLVLGCALSLYSCDIESRYFTTGVTLKMDIERTSCGFIEAKFHTSQDAYYYISVEPVREGVDPMQISSQFMTLALDYAYKEYINWRFELLYNGEEHIAPFSSHSLQYGDQDYFFTDLTADTDYWVFGFVVDPDTNTPCGELVLQTVHTDATSQIKVHFNYRINDTWDYVYPYDENESLISIIPWIGETIDSTRLRDEIQHETPGEYFAERFEELRISDSANVFYGMYAHNNNGAGDGTSETEFIEGNTYYTAIASFDGPIIMEGEYKNWNIYKFKWSSGLKQKFTPADDTLGAW